MTEQAGGETRPIMDAGVFMQLFESIPEGHCLHIVDGIVPGPNETEVVEATSYSAPMIDFVDVFGDKHKEHFGRSLESERFAIPIERPADSKYGFDPDMPYFRWGRINVLVHDERVPARILALGNLNQSDYWLVKDTPTQ